MTLHGSPAWARRSFRRITQAFASSGALFGFGLLALLHGLRFLEVGAPMPPTIQGLEFLTDILPLWVYGGLWAFSGSLCLLALRFRILTWWALGSIIGMTGMWWMFYFGGYFYAITHGKPSVIYYIASFYLCIWVVLLGELARQWREDGPR